MKNNGEHIDYDKLTAYIAGEGSEEERQAMQKWIEASEDNRKIYEQHKKVFNLDYTSDIPPDDQEDAGVIFNTDKAWNKVAQKTGLAEEGSKTIQLPSELPDEDKEVDKSFPWLKIAASVLIGAAFLFYLLSQQDDSQVTISFEEGINEYYLPDSSRIVLNGSSEIRYDKDFNRNNRSIRLEGKAYFDVIRNEELPLTVDTEYGQVRVLGTAFVVDENEDNMTVEVERGKVSLASHGSDAGSKIILEQSEKGTLDIENNTLTKTTLPSLNHLYWANQKLTYRQAPLQEVLTDLAGIFEKEILYNPNDIADCRVSAVFSSQRFEDILQNVSVVMNFDYVISENRIEIISNGCGAN